MRNNEYEVTDINEYKRDQKNKNTFYNYYMNINNKKEYTPFRKGLINIRENKKEIEKDEITRIKSREFNHHKIFISNNKSDKNKNYKTSTQNNSFPTMKYNLDSLNEYEIDINSANKYKNRKNEDNNDKNVNININEDNYFKEMKNLEEEIELGDDNEQGDYIPSKQLLIIKDRNQNPKSLNIINKNIKTQSSFLQNYIKNNYEPISSIYKINQQQSQNNTNNNINSSYNNITNRSNKYTFKINSNPLQLQHKNLELQYIPKSYNINYLGNNKNKDPKINPNIRIEYQHREECLQNNKENEDQKHKLVPEIKKDEENISKKSKYSSYFGDSNNNYYEIKGISEEKKEENEDEKEKEQMEKNENIENKKNNKNDNKIVVVRNNNFGIQSENKCIQAESEEDNNEKEADEQIMEEDEQMDKNESNENNYNYNEEDKEKKISEEENNTNIEYNNNKFGNRNYMKENAHKKIEINSKANQMEQIIEDKNENTQEEVSKDGEEKSEQNEYGNMDVTEKKIGEEVKVESDNEEESINMNEEEEINEGEDLNEKMNEEYIEFHEYMEGKEIDENDVNEDEEILEKSKENDENLGE